MIVFVLQFDLVCDKAIFGTISSSLIFAGWILGALIGGVLADKFGRKIMVFVFGFLIALFSLLSAFPNTYWLFALFRSIVGISIGMYNIDTVPYGIEGFHVTSRRPCWRAKTMKRRPCWRVKQILWELNSFLM